MRCPGAEPGQPVLLPAALPASPALTNLSRPHGQRVSEAGSRPAGAEQQTPTAQTANRAGVRDFQPLRSTRKGDEEQSCEQLRAVRPEGSSWGCFAILKLQRFVYLWDAPFG